jgi:hypothetical protein
MQRRSARSTRKRPVNLTLSEDLGTEAKGVTDNLSGVVESLLGEFLSKLSGPSTRTTRIHRTRRSPSRNTKSSSSWLLPSDILIPSVPG